MKYVYMLEARIITRATFFNNRAKSLWSSNDYPVVWMSQSIASGIIAILMSRNLRLKNLVRNELVFNSFMLHCVVVFTLCNVVFVFPANRTSNRIVPERLCVVSMLHWAALGHQRHCCPQRGKFDGGMQRHAGAHQRSVACQCPMPVRYDTDLRESELSSHGHTTPLFFPLSHWLLLTLFPPPSLRIPL